jgi:putative ABC transport system permease protein
VVAAGLFIRTFDHLASLSLGFDHARILVVTVTAPTVAARDRNPFYHRLVHAAAATPGVLQAGGSLDPPPLFPPMADQLLVTVPGAETRSAVDRTSRSRMITPGWLGSYGMGISAGRDIDERDTPSTRPVMIVNAAFVRQFFHDTEALGATVTLTLRAPFGEISVGSKTIVGIVGDAVFTSIREPTPPTLYLPLAQRDGPILNTNFYLSVRASAGSPLLLTRELTTALTAINRDLTLTFRPLNDQVRASLAQERLLAALSGFFGVLALLLAGLGLYGVTAYAVVRRRAEIGIRMALGAAPANVVGLVLARVGLLVGLGVLLGAAISLWASKFVASLLYGLEPRDPATLLGAAITLAVVGGVAGWLPAYRASRIDPAEVLREG